LCKAISIKLKLIVQWVALHHYFQSKVEGVAAKKMERQMQKVNKKEQEKGLIG